MRFKVLTAASMMFRAVFWVVLPCKMIVDNLSGAERRALRSLRTNSALKAIHADKGNATVVLDTMDYNEKISALLRAPTYRRLAKDPH
jgi:hypothetical protein